MAFIGNQPTSVAFLTDTFSGNAVDITFTLSAAPATTSSIIVAVSGVLQDPSTYAVAGTTLTFSAAPPTGTDNISVRFLGIPASGVTTTAYRTVTEFTATAGQTTFSVPSYTVGYIDVYQNGVLLGSADYTATNGTTVVLAAGATAGDWVETISFYVSSVLNAIPATAGAVNSTYITDDAITTAKIDDGAVTQDKLSTYIAPKGTPAFSAYASGATTISASNVATKVLFATVEFDTNSNFSSSRFTPTVAGYYQINSLIVVAATTGYAISAIYKNGSLYKYGSFALGTASGLGSNVCSIVYCNGSTDYIEIYALQSNATTQTNSTGSALTWFNGALVRAA